MGEEGYHYADPHAALEEFTQTPGYRASRTPDDREVATAVAGATCKATTGFWESVAEAELAVKSSLVERMLPDLEKVRDRDIGQAANAAKILESLGAKAW
ncbi:MAG: hypothetical protein LBK72_01155 [Bifidobacteriaceae bacterium]|jgi:hypothetical protein|nr:hypothetical protein [Bifidobacteriaceae bacterium]